MKFFSGYFCVILFFQIFSFVISGCGTQQTTPIQTLTQTALPHLPAYATSTIKHYEYITVTPWPTFIPSMVEQIFIPSELVSDLRQEKIVELLVNEWLETYKTEIVRQDAISDYKVDEVMFLAHPNHPQYAIVGQVLFSVVAKYELSFWPSMSASISNANDPWFHLVHTFAIIIDEHYYRLKSLPGWGT